MKCGERALPPAPFGAPDHQPVKGRGAASNPSSRFDRLAYEPDPGEEPAGSIPTQVFVDASRSILTENESPDIHLRRSLNPYRGCAHGCSYCFARPYHEYLGLSAGLDFETKIFAKPRAPELLAEEIARPGYEPLPIVMSSVTDAYQPVERQLGIARRCLEVLRDAHHPVAIITKSALVERDVDLLADLARSRAALVLVSITTLDADLQRAMEPRASTPRARLGAIRALSAAGVPTFVNAAPMVPGLTDHELPAILEAARDAGAKGAGWILVRLPHGLKDLFADWLERHVPLRKEKVLNTLRAVHGGKLYDSDWGKRMHGEGPRAEQIGRLFDVHCRRLGLNAEEVELSAADFRAPVRGQMELF